VATLDFMMSPRLQRVLSALMLNPDRSFSLSELLRIGGGGHGATQNIVKALGEAGLVRDRRMGNQRLFTVNTEHPLYPELRSIALKTFGLRDRLREALVPFGDRIDMAFVFGSMANGTDRADSDIDLMIVGDVDLFEVNAALAAAEADLRRPIHANVYSPREWNDMQADSLVRSIAAGPKMMVVGHEPGRDAGGPDQQPREDRIPEAGGP
jgi:uncharacterized protein